jgi:hypothetical protein
MLAARALSIVLAVLFLGIIALSEATPHGDGHSKFDVVAALPSSHVLDSGHRAHTHGIASNLTIHVDWSDSFSVPNYFRHSEHVFWIYSHIIAMTIAWALVLPIGKQQIPARLETAGEEG